MIYLDQLDNNSETFTINIPTMFCRRVTWHHQSLMDLLLFAPPVTAAGLNFPFPFDTTEPVSFKVSPKSSEA